MPATSSLFPTAFLSITRFLIAFVLATMLCGASAAQEAPDAQPFSMAGTSPRPLITQSIDEARLTTLRGNTHPLARPEFDLGTAPASLPMQRMLLELKP